ncbi:GYF domain-containing protein [Cerasicoccus fimbriatus]|uniref:GYF domain-containing protein n=1 Tax=Cerasicoccus fimbriatus TaxID=3014554 RepID=UPI0022B43309|nr:GYF domain-containing protein [Cerasicoccus sp. TK19100]
MSDAHEKIWYYAESGQQVGPFTGDEMKNMVASKKIAATTPVWKNGMAEWTPIAQVPELAEAPAPKQPEPHASEDRPTSLKLGAERKYKSVNEADENADAGINVTDMLNAGPQQEGKKAPAKQEPRIVAQSKVGFFESFGLGSFESAFFAITLVLGGIACAIKFDYWHTIVIGVGFLWMFAAGIALIVRAFMRHWGWGLVYLLVPFGALVYIIVDIKSAFKPLLLYVVGLAACIAAVQSPGFEESPLFEFYQEYAEQIEAEIEKQQQEMEESRNERLDQFSE